MVYDCGSCMAKYILCCFNFLIFLAGSLVLGVGIWLLVDKSSFIGLSKIVPSEHVSEFTQPGVIEQGSYILIAIGGLMFIVSFLGYCGSIKESQCMLTTYGILLLIILILEITVGCLAVAYKTKAEEETKNLLKLSLKNYYSSENSENPNAVSLAWDHLQASLQCCGVDDYTNYQENDAWSKSDKVVPESCCVLDGDPLKLKPLAPTCTSSPNDVNSYFKKGCYTAVINWIMSNLNVVIGIAVAFGLIEIIGVIFAFCLTKSINNS